jgi:hypothetical protein
LWFGFGLRVGLRGGLRAVGLDFAMLGSPFAARIISFVRQLQQNIGVARLIKSAPTDEILAAQLGQVLADPCEFFAAFGQQVVAKNPLAIFLDCLLATIFADIVRVAPFAGARHADAVGWLAPSLRSLSLYPVRHFETSLVAFTAKKR